MSIIDQARIFAIAAHSAIGQRRKYTNTEYWTHPCEVANIVAEHGGTDQQIAAAWLHDTVEDTEVELETIHALFGTEVAHMVSDLTDVSKPQDGNRAQRKAIDWKHTADALPASKSVKLADLIHNTGSIVAYDKKFASVYLQEKELLLNDLSDADIPSLYELAVKTLQDAQRVLVQDNLDKKLG